MMGPNEVRRWMERTQLEQLELPWPEPFRGAIGAQIAGATVESPLLSFVDAAPRAELHAVSSIAVSRLVAPDASSNATGGAEGSATPKERNHGGRNHGGRRHGAGRKRGPQSKTLHRERDEHDPAYPVRVVLRVRPELIQTLRVQQIRILVKNIVWDQLHPSRIYAEAFRVVDFDIQRHEIHLVVEAKELPGVTTKAGKPYTATQALRGGVSGFMISFAHRFNALYGRKKGKVWASRYERHDLRTAEEARAALESVFRMGESRGEVVEETGIDPFSSGVAFGYFENAPGLPELGEEEWPVLSKETVLARGGWRQAGPIYSSIVADFQELAAPPVAPIAVPDEDALAETIAERLERVSQASFAEYASIDDEHRHHVALRGRPTSALRAPCAMYRSGR